MDEKEKQESERIKFLDPKTATLVDSKPIAADCLAATELAVCHRSMPEIAMEKDLFPAASDKSSDAQPPAAVEGDPSKAPQDRNFFSDTIVPAKDAVAKRAYAIYLEQGSQPGHDAENWAKAEAQIDTRAKE